jgi:hypothetical protein
MPLILNYTYYNYQNCNFFMAKWCCPVTGYFLLCRHNTRQMLFPETNKVFKTELISLKRKIVFKISRNDVCVFCRWFSSFCTRCKWKIWPFKKGVAQYVVYFVSGILEDICLFLNLILTMYWIHCNNEDKNNRDASSVGVNPHLCRERRSLDLVETHNELFYFVIS